MDRCRLLQWIIAWTGLSAAWFIANRVMALPLISSPILTRVPSINFTSRDFAQAHP